MQKANAVFRKVTHEVYDLAPVISSLAHVEGDPEYNLMYSLLVKLRLLCTTQKKEPKKQSGESNFGYKRQSLVLEHSCVVSEYVDKQQNSMRSHRDDPLLSWERQ